MIFSVHIPKTAGSSFRFALEERFGPRLAVYYGPGDPKTTPQLRIKPEALADAIPQLERDGFEILHGHFHPDQLGEAARAPDARLWTWLRDPVERTISHFSFFGERSQQNVLATRVKGGEVGLDEFARTVRNFQTRYLRGFGLDAFEFVGVTERFELGLAVLFEEEAPKLKRRFNATDDRAVADEKTRRRIASLNVQDLTLYAEALTTFLDRVVAAGEMDVPDRPQAAGAGLFKRLIRKVA